MTSAYCCANTFCLKDHILQYLPRNGGKEKNNIHAADNIIITDRNPQHQGKHIKYIQE